MPDLIKDFTVGFNQPGSVEIAIRGNGVPIADATMDVQAAANLAALLLKCAFQASQGLAEATPGQITSGEVVPLSMIALLEHQSDLHQTLVLGLGLAQVGFAISNDSLMTLGQSFLLAATSTHQRPN
jgi:hypothetical protein